MQSQKQHPFPDSHLWTRRYQRNNKQAGLKNIRCFPYCSSPHKIRGFCGNGVVVSMSANDPCLNGIPVQNLRCWAAFLPLKLTTSPDFLDEETRNSGLCPNMYNYEYDISVGQVVNEHQIKKFARTPSDPFNPWYTGERVKDASELSDDSGAHSSASSSSSSSSSSFSSSNQITFSINRNKRGWHYGWIANKHTCDEPHILRAYICASVPGSSTSLRCIARFDSPSFTIFCRRRLRDHVADLPEQLKSIEHMQLRKKEFQAMIEQDPSILLKLKEKKEQAKLQQESDSEISSDQDEMDSPTKANKRKRTNSEKASAKSFGDDVSNDKIKPKEKKMRKIKSKTPDNKKSSGAGSSSSNSNADQSYDEFDGMEDIDLSENKVLPISPSASGESEDDFFMTLSNELLLDNQNPFAFEDANETAMSIFPISPIPRPRSNSNIESKEDLIIRIMSALVQISEFNENDGNNPSSLSSSSSSTNVLENGSTEDIADYLDSFLKSDIKNQMDVSSDTAAISAQSKNVDEVLKSLAYFLIHETDFSNEVGQALTSTRESLTLNDEETQSPKQIFISVLEKHLNSFLSKYSLMISDLDNMISVSKYSRLGNSNSICSNDESSTDLDNRLRSYMNKPPYFESLTKVRTRKCKSAISENRQETATRLMAAINKTYDLEDLTSLAAPTNPEDIFEQYPEMDLTGNWRRPESTLRALEKLREHAGFPWFVRKMLKEMESTFELFLTPTELKVYGKRKFLSSGFFSYELNGNLIPFHMQNLLPGEEPFSNSKACAILYPENECVLLIQRFSDTIRLVRATSRNPSVNELQSVVTIQGRQSTTGIWHNQMVVNVIAIPHVVSEEMNESKIET